MKRLIVNPSHFHWRPTALAAVLATTVCLSHAQQSPAPLPAKADSESVLDQVNITARKRPEAAQTAPLAVTAFNNDTLERGKISLAQDLQFSIPNAVLVANERFNIRGIGSTSIGGESGVGTAFNGAAVGYLPQDELFDIGRIEVLRGPQGTLFGRNTTGGALAVFTQRPTNKLEGNVSLELGNFNQRRYGGMLNIPVSDALQQRFSGYTLKRDGFTMNEHTGNGVDGRNQYSVRSSTRLHIGDKAEANLVLGAYDENSSRMRESKRLCKATPVLGCSPNELGFDSPDTTNNIVNTLLRAFSGAFPAGGRIYAGAPNPTDYRRIAADFDATYKAKQKFATLDFNYELSDKLSFNYVGGFSDFSTEQNTDWDNAALPFRFTKPLTYKMAANQTVTTDRLLTTDSVRSAATTRSHEFRLQSHNKGMFNYTTGVFLFEQESNGGFYVYNPAFEVFAKARSWGSEAYNTATETKLATTKATAWFGDGQWALSNKMRATLGARYTSEQRNTLSRNIVLTDSLPFTQKPEIKTDTWTGRAAVDYAPANDMLLYGSMATGYKGGGFNAANASKPTYDPETVTAYEMGMKNMLLDGKLRANFSVFYNDYKNMQISQRISASAITTNADARTSGIEAEFQYAPSRSWLFDANIGLLNTSIGDFSSEDAANPAQSLTARAPNIAVNLSGNKLPYSPASKMKIGAQYTTALANTGWSVTSRVDYVWQDKYFAREFNTPNDAINAWGVMNLQMRFLSPDGKTHIKTYVKNVSNANNITSSIIEDALVGSYRNVRLLDPRTFGVQVEYKF